MTESQIDYGRRLMVVSLVLIVAFALMPLISAISAGFVAQSLGCRLDESGSHPCMLWGSDIGDTLLVFFVMGWFELLTLPLGGLALLLWLGVAAWRAMARRRRAAPHV